MSNLLRLTAVLLTMPGAVRPSAQGADTPALQHFELRVRPLLIERCVRCHGPEKQRAELRLDRAADFRKGSESGPLLGERPDDSLLLRVVRYEGDIRMPPDGKLGKTELADLEQWVRSGAPWPDEPSAASTATASNPSIGITDEARQFWAFQPPQRSSPPEVADASRVHSPIDRFIVSAVEKRGLTSAPPADNRTLLRRATLDLIGLPPTTDEVEEFLSDPSDDALARALDRLLASPHYGERQGRRWLDVARYADSNGLDENMAYEHAWRYRDYVIRAFNGDKPFDRFVHEQLAGDLLTEPDGTPDADALTATGFLTLGPKALREVDAKKMEVDIIDEQVSTLGEAFLGMTLGCARCHDHKFDPIPTEDYYALAGVFSSTRTMKSFGSKAGVGDGDWQLRKLPGEPPIEVMAVTEGTVHDLPIHVRGSHLSLTGSPVPRGFPKVLSASPAPSITAEQSGRLQLAAWLTQPHHPLTSRVIVNRIWQSHFGQGLVRSPNNFGYLGQRPDHPELLDWLATTLIADGWSLKQLHRRIMLSQTYQMSTQENALGKEADPDNRLLWRMNRRRMDAETLRDSLLAVSGRLDSAMYGSLMTLKDHQSVTDSQSGKHLVQYEHPRRSVYLPVIRNVVYDFLKTFDFPDPSVPSDQRAATVVAPQALFLMNSEFVTENSRHAAERFLAMTGLSDDERLDLIYRTMFSRPASAEETTLGLEFLSKIQETSAGDEKCRVLAWQSLCHALAATNEFISIE